MVKDLSKKLLYRSGLLGLYHRVRNSRSLTVVMFHRILREDDPRWPSSDPGYTLTTDVLAQSLRFFKRHYNVVSLAQVLDARRGGTLPPRALLITFDDGWADNADHALPELKRAGLPALMFVVADAVGRRQPFYQESIIAAWRRGALGIGELRDALRVVAPGSVSSDDADDGIDGLRAIISRIERLSPADREALVCGFRAALDDGLRHMVDVEDLQQLLAGGVALGAHGKTHVPMTSRHADVDAELAGARAQLSGALEGSGAAIVAMSFPHGAHDQAIAERARESGYELAFTSVPVLNPACPQPGWLLGRTGFERDNVVDSRGSFRPDWLALYLFRPPLRALG
jgi:peptidoglycan/xylan/chitin deacetylase (PgdA/CDA1 family)